MNKLWLPPPDEIRTPEGLWNVPASHRFRPHVHRFPGYPCCCPTTCPGCLSGTIPDEMQVVIAGVTDDSGFCVDPDGTLVLEFKPEWDGLAAGFIQGACVWFLDDSGGPSTRRWWLFVAPSYGMAVWASEYPQDYPPSVVRVKYGVNLGASKPDCTTFNNQDVPFIWEDDFHCDWTNSTCTVTSL